MARKVLVEMLDDLDGSAATQTIRFAVDGVSYEIDLSNENAHALRTEFARYIAAGRRLGSPDRRPAGTSDRRRNQRIRAWASANGFEVSERGRLSSEVISAYERAAA